MQNNIKTKIVFMGTPDFAVPSLVSLIENKYTIVSVLTQADKPVGRKQEIQESPIKKVAIEHGIPVLQPETVKNNPELVEKLKALEPDLIIVVAYGFILPSEILQIPKHGVINVHASLLPRWRGASPINHAILTGDKKTGVTIMQIDEKVDHGSIISQLEVDIEDKETAESLHDKLKIAGAHALINALPDYLDGSITPQTQDESLVTLAPKLSKENGKIDWTKSAQEIESMIRAFFPWPCTWTTWDNKIIKILDADVSKPETTTQTPGQVFLTSNNQLAVQCGKNTLIINKLQLEGKSPQSAMDFLNGHREFLGSVLK